MHSDREVHVYTFPTGDKRIHGCNSGCMSRSLWVAYICVLFVGNCKLSSFVNIDPAVLCPHIQLTWPIQLISYVSGRLYEHKPVSHSSCERSMAAQCRPPRQCFRGLHPPQCRPPRQCWWDVCSPKITEVPKQKVTKQPKLVFFFLQMCYLNIMWLHYIKGFHMKHEMTAFYGDYTFSWLQTSSKVLLKLH